MWNERLTDGVLSTADRMGGSEEPPASSGNTQQITRPRRIVLLAAFIIFCSCLVYILHLICSFILQIAENESFLVHVSKALMQASQSSNWTDAQHERAP